MTTRIMVINNSDKILAVDDREVFLQLFLNSDLRDVRRIKPDLVILDYYVGREGVDRTDQNITSLKYPTGHRLWVNPISAAA